jgi:hypothetical protein
VAPALKVIQNHRSDDADTVTSAATVVPPRDSPET